MYHLLGLEENLKAVAQASKQYMDGSDYSFPAVKKAFFSFTTALQPNLPPPSSSDGVHLVDNIELTKQLAEFFMEDSVLNDTEQQSQLIVDNIVDDDDWRRKIALLTQALSLYKALLNEHYQLFILLFSYIFIARSEEIGGGTTSAALGILHVDPRKKWTTSDLIEVFVHETAHQLIFLDEYRFRHYHDRQLLADPDTYALSAVLCVNRPLDKVFHSLIVNYEILAYREKYGKHGASQAVHPCSPQLLQQMQDTINSIEDVVSRKDLLTERSLSHLKTIQSKVHDFETVLA